MKSRPIKARTGIRLAIGRNVLMARNIGQRVAPRERLCQNGKSCVLCIAKCFVIGTFEFDADGKIIAALSTLKFRHAGMPRAVERGNELDGAAVTPNQKMR